MEQIIWTEEFSVGVKRLDEQHKRLIAMINRLMGAPRAKTRSERISDLLSDMTKYAQEHFQTEEDLMRQYDYPHLYKHLLSIVLFGRRQSTSARPRHST